MIARAPGKLVISGAYAVLEGAPALVAAVNRYVVADTGRAAVRSTPEVREALARRGSMEGEGSLTQAPWFDATALRDETAGRKLGLGSSAAILVASLAALELARDPDLTDGDLAGRVLGPALVAHSAAQRGGSGVDVAASALGGILRFERASAPEMPRIEPANLPEALRVEVWSSKTSASTPDMLAHVAAFAAARPREHRRVMDRLCDAAQAVANAPSAAEFIEACREQATLLADLGDLADVPIVTREARAFGRAVANRGVVLPSGAGGGDLVLYLGSDDPYEDADIAGGAEGSRRVTQIARNLGFAPLELLLGTRGVHAASGPWQSVERNQARS